MVIKKQLRKILLIYGVAFILVIIIGVITKSTLATLTFLVAAIFAPLRIIFPGYSSEKNASEKEK